MPRLPEGRGRRIGARLTNNKIIMENNTIVPVQEIEKYQKEIKSAEKFSLDLEVKTDADYEAALAEGKVVKTQLDAIVARKEEITKPMYSSYKSILALFKPIETSGEAALAKIKSKMLAYKQAQAAKVEADKQKLAERVERGTMKPETAVRKMDAMQAPVQTVKTDAGKATTKKVKKYRLVDVYALPKEFLKPTLKLSDVADTDKVKAAFKLGQTVAGVEEYIEEELSLG